MSKPPALILRPNKGFYRLSNRIEQKNVNLRREITGYDEREIMQMMYPNEDVDSEDFEDGFDIEDFYDED